MTGPELIEKMRALNINSVRFAVMVGVSRQQVYNWRTGKSPVPRFVVLIIFLLERLTAEEGNTKATPPDGR